MGFFSSKSEKDYTVTSGYGEPTSSDGPASEDGSRRDDVFGAEENHDIKYKKLSWPAVAILMIAEIVSNGMLSLPSSLAVVGMVPGLIIIIFLGIFATYTSWLLVKFKLRHPEVHTMGDAGYIMFGPIGRELMAFGTCCFAIFACGGQLLAGQIALAALSDNKLCLMLYTGIFTIPTLLLSLPRTFHGLGYISIISVLSILIAGIVGMAAASINPDPTRSVEVAVSSDFYTAFASITNPVFSFAGHFMYVPITTHLACRSHLLIQHQVLRPHLRDEGAQARHALRLHPPGLHHPLLCHLCRCLVRLPRQQGRFAFLLVAHSLLAEGLIRHCHP